MRRIYVTSCRRFLSKFHILLFAALFLYWNSRIGVLNDELQVRYHHLEAVHLDCPSILSDINLATRYAYWNLDSKSYEEELLSSENICETLDKRFLFEKEPLSDEEADYPLAYGLLIHKNIIQFLLQLSIFYHPQNAYCIVVDGTASKTFRKFVMSLPKCFANVVVFTGKRSQWGTYGILDNVYRCFKHLTLMEHDWKYYQYLSGSDLPMRTNLEMVRIMKALNGSINSEVEEYELNRYHGMEKVQTLMNYLYHTFIPDESFWSSVAGNPALIQVPGSFKAREIIWLRKHLNINPAAENTVNSVGTSYIGRYQIWEWQGGCLGKWRSWSCVFGIMDVPYIITRPELVVHKMDLNFQPAGFMCLLKEIRRRSHIASDFDARSYGEMPTVELHGGRSITELTHPDWIVRSSFYRPPPISRDEEDAQKPRNFK
ncbi:unnamed protein product [Nippostrongylus brasiliensis]|uniref:GLY-1 (inferred by orthology to a C. elegans protein) n=1 Tax=Nippostrongylus brasiliensis TaxID=27835 RepID=A0A0N4YEZ9_NIPBR|nr:unnamed protein product [Nippostrongylus brasiliensis]